MKALELKKLSTLVEGLSYDAKSSAVYGELSGFPVCVYATKTNYVAAIFAKQAGSGENSGGNSYGGNATATAVAQDTGLASLLDACKAQSGKRLSSYTHQQHGVRVQFVTGRTVKKTMEAMADCIRQVIDYLRGHYYVGCCDCCGAETGKSIYLVNGAGAALCPACREGMVAEMEQRQEQAAQKRGSIVTGIVGAFLGSLIGVALWVVVSMLGYIAGIVGLVLAVCTFKGYEKFGGKLNMAGVVLCLVIIVGMVYFANVLSLSMDIYTVFRSDYGITFFNAFQAVPEFLSESEVSGPFYLNMVIGYLFTIVASASSVINIYRQSNHKYSIQALG